MKLALVFGILLYSLIGFAQDLDDIPPEPEAPYPGSVEEDDVTLKTGSGPVKKNRRRKISRKKRLREKGEIIEGNRFRGKRKVKHPLSKKGLYRITADGEYYYRTKPTPLAHSASVKFGSYFPENMYNPENGASFDLIYPDASGIIALFDYEWRVFSSFGKFGWKFGSGLYFANGTGIFAEGPNKGTEAQEQFTLIMFPNSFSAVYYLQYWRRQPLIPYVEGGVDLYLINESRDDGEPPLGRFGGAYAAHFAAGLAIPLSFLSLRDVVSMDQEYGINEVFFTAEYRSVVDIGGVFDMSANYFNGGILVEF